MTPERWGRIKEVFEAALERDADDCAAFLDEACGSDDELRRHVELLLEEHRAASKIRSPLRQQDLSGKTVSHYRVVEKIGEGGMGVVYKAADLKLHRTVALKFIRPDAIGSEELKARFLHEAEAAAALDHPNICTVHEIDEVEGHTFLVMSYVDGETISDKIKRRPRPLEEALRVAVGLAEGLHAAHRKGVVHRDIKSANVMTDAEGRVKIMDFGLARLAGATKISEAGTVAGTPGYMSPEQVRGEAADQRSDVWSLGVVLYEMVTGHLPFQGESAQSVALAIQNEAPKALTALRSGTPLELERIVGKALAKEPAARYQHADEMVVDLRVVAESLERKEAARAPGRRTAAMVFVASLAILIAAAAILFRGPPGGAVPAGGEDLSIAVMPFVNLSGDEEHGRLCDGLTEELSIALGRLRGLNVFGRVSVQRWKNKEYDVRELGELLGVDAILDGKVQIEGSQLRVTVQLADTGDGFALWSHRFDREMGEFLDVQDEIAQAVIDTLQIRLDVQEEPLVGEPLVDNVEAYGAYLEGLHYLGLHGTFENYEKAEERLRRAVALDPDFARAHARLSILLAVRVENFTSILAADYMPEAKEHALRALALDNRDAAGHWALGYVLHLYDWDWTGAEREYRLAMELDPSSARTSYSWFMLHMGRYDESIALVKQILASDPFALFSHKDLAQAYMWARRYEEALDATDRLVELDPRFPPAYFFRWQILTLMGRYDEALEAAQKSSELYNRPFPGLFAYTLACAGRRQEALDVLPEGEPPPGVAYWQALIETGLGDRDEAFKWLETAFELRDPKALWITRPDFDPLRSDPRYQALLDRLNLPTGPARN